MTIHTSLAQALFVSVPWRMADLKRSGGPTEGDTRDAVKFIMDCAEARSILTFKNLGFHVNESAKLYNALASALAILSFKDGGVEFLDQVWDITRTPLPEMPKG